MSTTLPPADRPPRAAFVLTLVDAGGPDAAPVHRRLAAGLKRLLRGHGLRCVRCAPAASAPPAAASASPPRPASAAPAGDRPAAGR